MAEQPLDVRGVWAQARAHPRMVAGAMLIGLALGAGSVTVLPPAWTSESRVLLPPLPSTGGEPAQRDGKTEIQVAVSDVVLGPAGQALTPPASVQQIAAHVRVEALTPNVLKFVAEADSAAAAEAIASAVAEAELAYLSDSLKTRTTTRAAVLTERETSLQGSLATVTRQIQQTRERQQLAPPGTPSAASDASTLAQLTAEQAHLVLALDDVRGLIAGEETGETALAIEKSSPARRPGLVGQSLVRGIAGAVLGLGVALLLLFVANRRDRRLRFRDEMADALGVVVLASVRSRVPRTTTGWAELLSGYEPQTVDAWTLRQLLSQLAVAAAALRQETEKVDVQPIPHPRSVTVISLAGDQGGLAMGPQLASYAASLDVTTHLFAALGHEFAPSLWATCGSGGHRVAGRPTLLTSTAGRGSEADLTVVLAVADPIRPVLAGLPSTDVTILALSPGTATGDDLARVAVSADDAGHRIVGVCVADPDDLDRTSGRLLHHERALQVPMPTHLTGLTPQPSVSGGALGGISRIRRRD